VLNKISKKTKFLLSFFLVVIFLSVGSVAVLAKLGKIDIYTFADNVTNNTTQNVTLSVKDKNDSIITGAFVSYENVSSLVKSSGFTDSSGKWLINLPNGKYNFSAGSSPNCKTTLKNKTVSSNSKNFTLKINCSIGSESSMAIIRGKVLETGGSSSGAIESATITVDNGNYSATTDKNGNYSLYVSSGNYNLYSQKSGYSMASTPLYQGNIMAGKTYDAPNILMKKDKDGGSNNKTSTYGSISGKITDSSSSHKPVAGAKINISDKEIFTDSNGNYKVENLNASEDGVTYTLKFSKVGFEQLSTTKSVVLHSNEGLVCDAEIRTTFDLSLTILDSNTKEKVTDVKAIIYYYRNLIDNPKHVNESSGKYSSNIVFKDINLELPLEKYLVDIMADNSSYVENIYNFESSDFSFNLLELQANNWNIKKDVLLEKKETNLEIVGKVSLLSDNQKTIKNVELWFKSGNSNDSSNLLGTTKTSDALENICDGATQYDGSCQGNLIKVPDSLKDINYNFFARNVVKDIVGNKLIVSLVVPDNLSYYYDTNGNRSYEKDIDNILVIDDIKEKFIDNKQININSSSLFLRIDIQLLEFTTVDILGSVYLKDTDLLVEGADVSLYCNNENFPTKNSKTGLALDPYPSGVVGSGKKINYTIKNSGITTSCLSPQLEFSNLVRWADPSVNKPILLDINKIKKNSVDNSYYYLQDFEFISRNPKFIVLDSDAKDPISNISLKFSDSGCPKFSEKTYISNNKGEIIITGDEFYSYLYGDGKFVGCFRLLQVTTFDPNNKYNSRTIDYNYPKELFFNENIIYLSEKVDDKYKIYGKVLSIEDKKPVVNAEVRFCYESPDCHDPVSVSTDAEGYYEFSGLSYKNVRIVIWALGKDYRFLDNSIMYLDRPENSPTEVDLYLSKLLTGYRIVPQVLYESTLLPANDEKGEVCISDKENVENCQEVNEIGYSVDPFVVNSSTNKLYFKLNNKIFAEKEISFPTNYVTMSEEEKYSVASQFVLFVKDKEIPDSNKINQFDISVKYKKTNKPVENAQIGFVAPYYSSDSESGIDKKVGSMSNDFKLANSLVMSLIGKTNKKGLYRFSLPLTFPKDKGKVFLSCENDVCINSIIDLKLDYISNDQTINITVNKDEMFETYIGKISKNGKQIEILIDEEEYSNFGTTEVEDNHNMVNVYLHNIGDEVITDGEFIFLERKSPDGNWVKTSYRAKELFGFSQGFYFRPLNGEYRVVVNENDNTRSSVSEPFILSEKSNIKNISMSICLFDDQTKLVKFGGVNLLLDGSDVIADYDSNKQYYNNLIQHAKKLKRTSIDVGNLTIAISSMDTVNGYTSDRERFNCYGAGSAYTMVISKELIDYFRSINQPNGPLDTITHEYSHNVYGYLRENDDNIIKTFDNISDDLIKKGSDYEYFINRVTDSTYALDRGGFGGHPWDDPSELFASFSLGYLSHNNSIVASILSGYPEHYEASNSLAYLYRLLSERYTSGGLYLRTFTTVGNQRISDIGYNFNNVTGGLWMNSNYSEAPLLQKIGYQFRYIMSVNYATLKKIINSYNQLVDSYFASINNKKLGNINGKIVAEADNIQVPDAMINSSEKLAISNNSGKFSINKVPLGLHGINFVKNAKNDVYYDISSPENLESTNKSNEQKVYVSLPAFGYDFENISDKISKVVFKQNDAIVYSFDYPYSQLKLIDPDSTRESYQLEYYNLSNKICGTANNVSISAQDLKGDYLSGYYIKYDQLSIPASCLR